MFRLNFCPFQLLIMMNGPLLHQQDIGLSDHLMKHRGNVLHTLPDTISGRGSYEESKTSREHLLSWQDLAVIISYHV